MVIRTNLPTNLDRNPCAGITENCDRKAADGSAPTSRNHPLLQDMWLAEDDPEYGIVRLEHIATIGRNLAAMETIARMLTNNSNEPDATGGAPLSPWTTASLLGGIESMCSFSKLLIDEMHSDACGCTD